MGHRAIITGGADHLFDGWLMLTMREAAAVDSRITRRQFENNHHDLIEQWRLGVRDFYADLGSTFQSVLPALKEFKPRVALIVRHPYQHVRAMLTNILNNPESAKHPQSARMGHVQNLMSQIYGSAELGMRLFDSLGLEWKPFGIRQLSTFKGFKAMCDYVGLELEEEFTPHFDASQLTAVPETLVDLDDWFPVLYSVMRDFDEAYPEALDLYRRVEEMG